MSADSPLIVLSESCSLFREMTELETCLQDAQDGVARDYSPKATMPTSRFWRLSTGKRRTCSLLMFCDADSVLSSSKIYRIVGA